MADRDYRRGLRYASEADLIGRLEELTGQKVLLAPKGFTHMLVPHGTIPAWESPQYMGTQARVKTYYDPQYQCTRIHLEISADPVTYGLPSGNFSPGSGIQLNLVDTIDDRAMMYSTDRFAAYHSVRSRAYELGLQFTKELFDPLLQTTVLESLFGQSNAPSYDPRFEL